MKRKPNALSGVWTMVNLAIRAAGVIGRWARVCWYLLVRNRLAIAIASLVWLIFRSGTQPRRISYPCQQVAAVNVGAFAAGLIPTLFLARRHHGPQTLPRTVVIRRQLLIAGIMFVAALIGIETYQFADSLIPPELPDVPSRVGDPVPTLVGIAQAAGTSPVTDPDDIEQLVREAVARAGGLDGLIEDWDMVVIKPNLVSHNNVPGNGIITNVHVVSAVVELVKEAASNVTVIIAEGSAWSDGENSGDVTFEAYRQYGYDTSPQDHWFDYDPTVQLVDLNDTGGWDQHNNVTSVNIPNGKIRTQYWVPSVLVDCDVLISVPTFKNHSNGQVTLALKNRVGCVPGDIYYNRDGNRQPLKRGLVHFTDTFGWTVPPAPADENETVRRTIVDLNLVRPQDFAVIDGLVGITNGPGGTETPSPYMRMIVAGTDSVAVDSVCTLAMGYDPDYVDHIAWADSTGALGTKDRAYITVVGDHVASVRYDFPIPYYDNVRAESTPPSLTNISLTEGQQVAGNVTVTAYGVQDNVGAIKAELSMAATAPPNLLTNGGFEDGSTGWTEWWGDWGSDRVWDYNNTESGHAGSACLKLGNSSTIASFGVYQEVPVQAGRTYKFDVLWKGMKYAEDWCWFETLIIDGPFSLQQADDGDYAEPNYMYAYDRYTYLLPGGYGTTFGWIWGHEQNYNINPYPESQIDWNSRAGLRQATGSVMTVVLKAGAASGTTGVAAWFDEVSLVDVNAELPGPQVVATTVIDPPSTGPIDVDIVWNSAGFAGGYYDATVTVYDAALNEAGITRNIELIQTDTPLIDLDPESLASTISEGGNPDNDAFTIANTGVGTLNYTIEVDQPWLSLSSYSGDVNAGAPPDQITVYYDCSGLAGGQHAATITVSDGNAYNSPQTIGVTVNVEALSPDFSADVTTGPAPLTVQFTDQSSLGGITEWFWEFGDGGTSDQQNPSHPYTADGRYTVRLTVTTPQGPATEEKENYIQVAPRPKVAFIGGQLPPTTSDSAVIEHLESLYLEVDAYDDERENRPAASVIAATHDLVVASSTTLSPNVAGDFRHESVPFIFWESALAWNSPEVREAIADGGVAIGGQTQIDVIDNTHPIMAGIPTGPVTLTTSGQDFSYCEGSVASGAQVLATAVGNSGRRTMIAVEPGAQLLDGGVAAGKRAILFLYDTTWLATNATGKQIVDNTVAWAVDPKAALFSASVTEGTAPLTVGFTDQSTGPVTLWTWDFGDGGGSVLRNPTYIYTEPGIYDVSLIVDGNLGQPDTLLRTSYIVVNANPADFDADGDVDGDDCDTIRDCLSGANVPQSDPDCIPTDLDEDNDVDQSDFGIFQRCLSGQDNPADPYCAD